MDLTEKYHHQSIRIPEQQCARWYILLYIILFGIELASIIEDARDSKFGSHRHTYILAYSTQKLMSDVYFRDTETLVFEILVFRRWNTQPKRQTHKGVFRRIMKHEA